MASGDNWDGHVGWGGGGFHRCYSEGTLRHRRSNSRVGTNILTHIAIDLFFGQDHKVALAIICVTVFQACSDLSIQEMLTLGPGNL